MINKPNIMIQVLKSGQPFPERGRTTKEERGPTTHG